MRDERDDGDEARRDPEGAVEIGPGPIAADEILVVRRGPGANCSSVGSALDLLFLSAVTAGVVMAGIAAAFGGDAEERKDKARGERDGKHDEGGDAGAR
ncbi:hypothetical protein [Polyangium fumosum]|uniref:Uncharacterized protein n=1 Tax=Polyangium fumosum TaxID=889272 RepID=A0A4U1JKJ8_9BACT|nr:hypothetical protein [Polyangium fumosum]TKD13311.1 hypothetical protein E8A74_01815 [Polyangium fumosum]